MTTDNITVHEPATGVGRSEPLNMIERLFRDIGTDPFWPVTGLAPAIRIDVQETEQAFEVKADIPGVKKEEIKLAVDGRQVFLSATSERTAQSEDNGVLWSERQRGQCQRSFVLPQEVDETQAQARYEDGVLSVTLPKKAGGGATRVTIQ